MLKERKKKLGVYVGVMIFKDGKVLIGRRKETASHGSNEYSFTGGQMDVGESFEESAARETFEEAGVRIKNLKFLCVSNIDRYESHQVVLIGLTADWESGEPQTFPDENIGEWQWCDLDNLPKPLFPPTHLIIDSYKTGKNYYDKE